MPVTPIPPVPVNENVPPNYPPGSIQPGASQVVVEDTLVLTVPTNQQNQAQLAFNEQLIYQIGNNKIAIAELRAENDYLKSQLEQAQNSVYILPDYKLESLYT